jgi:hypothetical protein
LGNLADYWFLMPYDPEIEYDFGDFPQKMVVGYNPTRPHSTRLISDTGPGDLFREPTLGISAVEFSCLGLVCKPWMAKVVQE